MVILGHLRRSDLAIGLVSCNGETSRNGWTETGELWICWLVSFSELNSACCFPFFVKDSGSDLEFDPSASFSDLDGGLESPSCLWISSLGSPRYSLPVCVSYSNSNQCPRYRVTAQGFFPSDVVVLYKRKSYPLGFQLSRANKNKMCLLFACDE